MTTLAFGLASQAQAINEQKGFVQEGFCPYSLYCEMLIEYGHFCMKSSL